MAWVAEDTFDSYPNGDLAGNNGGSGWAEAWGATVSDADYDVQGTTTFNGSAKAVQIDSAGGGNIMRIITTPVTSGVVYVAMRGLELAGDTSTDFMVDASNIGFRITFLDSGVVRCTSGAGHQELIATFSTAVFYLFEATLNGDDTYDIRYHNGTSWSSSFDGLAYEVGGDIDRVRFNNGAMNAVYDYISPTDPFGPVGSSAHNFSLMGVGT